MFYGTSVSPLSFPTNTVTPTAANGISVAVLSATSQGFVVTVSNGSGGPASYTLSMTVTGSGTVTSNPPGIVCSAGICSSSFPRGSWT